ncbi:MAG: DUF1800 domain-containing protein [Rubrivivax sp.]|nr:DUF1800 domain-containing protein [Rubrivivax sp.]
MRHVLAAGSAREVPQAVAAVATVPVPTVTELLDWAERVYTVYFPGHQANLVSAPYTYRYYAQTGNYVGVADGRVYIYGPVSGGPLGDVGALADYGTLVYASTTAFTDAQAARFLGQATLGYGLADIAAVRSLGYGAWLDQEFSRPISQSNWDWLVSKGFDSEEFRNAAGGVDAVIWQRLITAPDGLRQRVALALSEILVVGFDGINNPFKNFRLAAWWDLLVAGAFGSFRTLLEQVTLSVAMGNYLNMAGNQKENPATGRLPDENYAREVMQLFTIGLLELNPDGTPRLDASGQPIETYTQDTVSQLSRVLTGWNFDYPRGELGPAFARRPMVLNAALHSTLSATFLGVTVPANTPGAAALKTALDTLAAHPNVGPFIGRQLIQRLVTSNPSPGYVSRVSAAFANNGRGVRGDLAAVVRAVLLDDEARTELRLTDPTWGKQREPMLRFIQWARTFKATSLSGDWSIGNTSDASRSLGQSPLRSPSVFNYFRPGYVPAGSPIGTAALVAPEFQLTNETSVAGYLNTMQTYVGAGNRDIRPDYTAQLALAADAAALVDHVSLLLSAGQLGPASRTTIVDAVSGIAATTDAGKANRVYAAVLLVMASLEYLVQK